jgi:hypothetical protein
MTVKESICHNVKYKAICRTIAKREHLADDLYQEFILRLLEQSDSKVNEAHEQGYLEWYCISIINSIWNQRNRIKTYTVGKTSPLFEYSNVIDTEFSFTQPTPTYDVDFDYTQERALDIIKSEYDSPNNELMYTARVFFHSNYTFKNTRKFAEKSTIGYRSLIKTCTKYKKMLIDKLKKYE